MTELTAASAPLQIHYQNTVEDWVVLERSFPARQRFAARWWPFLFLLMMAVVCCLPSTVLLVYFGHFGAAATGWSLVAIFLGMVYFAIKKPGPPDPKILRPVTLTLHSDYFEVASDRGWERRDWSLIARLQPLDELFVVHRDDGLVYVVPHRAFPTAQAAEAFLQTIHHCHEQANTRAPLTAPAAWQNRAGPPLAFSSDTLRVTFSTAAEELRQLQGGMVLQPVGPQPQKPARPLGRVPTLLLAAVASVAFLMLSRADSDFMDGMMALVVFVGLSLLMVWPLFRALKILILRTHKPAPEVAKTITISPAGISLWAPGLESHSAWESIDAVQQNDRVVVFSADRPTTIFLYAIPKSAFPDPFQASHFAETAARYRRAAADRQAEEALDGARSSQGETDWVLASPAETGNPYQPPQTR